MRAFMLAGATSIRKRSHGRFHLSDTPTDSLFREVSVDHSLISHVIKYQTINGK
jgi:hypothetical protein